MLQMLLLYLLQLFTLSWSVQVFSMISDLNLARKTKFMLIGNTIFVSSARVWGGLVSIDFLFIDVKIVDVYGTCCAVLSPALCWHRARTNNRWDSFCQQLQCWMGILSWERFRSSSSYQSSEASEIMHLKVLFDLHHSDSSPLNGSGNGELIFVYRLEDFPWFPIKTTLSLSVCSNTNFNIQEVAWSYRRVDSRAVVDTQQREEQRRAASSSQQPVARYNENLGNFKCRRNIRKVL